MAAEPKPFSDDKTNPELLRDKKVVKEPTKSFEERTRVVTPWLNQDGTQNNGAEDLAKAQKDTVEGKAPEKTQTAGKKAVGKK